MASCVADELLWSDSELTLRKFVKKTRQDLHLPVVVKTTAGHADNDDINDIAKDEIYWVYAVECQRRIIAKTEDNRYVSIPLDYKLKFQTVPKRNAPPGPALSLSKTVDRGNLCGQRIKLATKETVLFDFSVEESSPCKAELGLLEVLDSYEEKYLLAHPIYDRKIHGDLIGIPVYLPISLKVAVGFEREAKGISTEFKKWLHHLSQRALSFHCASTVFCKEILVFDQPPSGDYEYINPSKYAKMCGDVMRGDVSKPPSSRPAGDDDGDDYEQIDDYEEIPPSMVNVVPTSHGVRPNDASKPKQPHADTLSVIPKRQEPSVPRPTERPVAKPRPQQQVETNRVLPRGNTVDSSSTPTYACSTKQLRPPSKAAPPALAPKPSRQRTDDTKQQPVTSVPPKPSTPVGKVNPLPTTSSNKPSVGVDAKKSCTNSTTTPVDSTLAPASKSLSSATTAGAEKNWQKLADVPLDFDSFNVEQVARSMELLGLPDLAAKFRADSVDGQLLLSVMTEEILVTDFNCRHFDAKKLMNFATDGWRPK